LQAQFRNATHPRAADADEMQAALASEQTGCACLSHFR